MAAAPQLAVSLQTGSCISQVMKDIVQSAREFQQDSAIGAIVLTGEGNKAFAAGADIKEMASKTYSQVQHRYSAPDCECSCQMCIVISTMPLAQ